MNDQLQKFLIRDILKKSFQLNVSNKFNAAVAAQIC